MKFSTLHVVPLGLMLAGLGTVVLVVRKQKPPLPALLPKKLAASSASSPAAGRPTIQLGASGAAVTKWQQFLVAQGQAISADGQFGPATQAATQAWQSAHGLAADGVVGPQSWAASGVT